MIDGGISGSLKAVGEIAYYAKVLRDSTDSKIVLAVFKTAPKSRLMLGFYASFMAFFISRTRTDVFSAFHEINRDMAYERSGHANSLLECYSDAMSVLSSLQQITTYKYALIYLPVSCFCWCEASLHRMATDLSLASGYCACWGMRRRCLATQCQWPSLLLCATC